MKLPTSIAELEIFLSVLGSKEDHNELDLLSILKSSPFPLEDISRAQALNTWLTSISPDKRQVTLENSTDTSDAFRNISSTALGLITLARARSCFNKEHQKILLNIRNGYFDQMQRWPDLAVTDQTLMLCDDSYSKGLPWPLHNRNGVLRDDSYFDGFVPKLVHSVMPSEELRGAIIQQSSLLTTLVFELVKNTQDHALFSASGEGIDDSVRLLLVRFYDLAKLEIPKNVSQGTPLEPHVAYLKALKDRPTAGLLATTKKRFRGVLEFSVLDSGPGFVGRRLQRDVGSDEEIDIEYDAVLSCLRAGHSSARNPNRGLGLNDVLRALRAMNGFIRVRTNRISAYREFKIYQDAKDSEVSGVLHDWKKGYSSKASAFAKVRGATVSVLVPVEV
ncbi:MAG: hypothetical protein ACOH2S_10730 [Janthinobacterium svalbardensis]